jgi:thiol-disulfide isomerase/thioredoxin
MPLKERAPKDGALNWVVRTVTVVLVLCLALLGIVLYRIATEPSTVVASDGPPGLAIGKFSPRAAPLPAPPVSFADQSGKTVTLADFRGRVVLINLCATWCAPCVHEMPSLARLQARLGGLTILAISEDRRGAEVVAPFIEKLGLDGLAIYLDPKNDVDHAFAVAGLPTSFLIDRGGRILGELQGAADWDSPDMVKLIETYLGPAGGKS